MTHFAKPHFFSITTTLTRSISPLSLFVTKSHLSSTTTIHHKAIKMYSQSTAFTLPFRLKANHEDEEDDHPMSDAPPPASPSRSVFEDVEMGEDEDDEEETPKLDWPSGTQRKFTFAEELRANKKTQIKSLTGKIDTINEQLLNGMFTLPLISPPYYI